MRRRRIVSSVGLERAGARPIFPARDCESDAKVFDFRQAVNENLYAAMLLADD
jgi:hypothetical protein